ncbi:uncharacterized protein LOC130216328 [Danio aesculapii]|uniref:uncharacterized protein LOC130216328 n=1 Tax=Danio aesculapii TaxID=1142201 RepID=UPI0024BFD2C4|nr:uncharacterized protein LOC130216328 [Danio aesculapii]
MFHRFCFCLCLWRLVGGEYYYQVLKGKSVTLSPDLTELKNDDQIQWRIRDTLIAEINVTANRFSVFDGVLDGRFRDRLKLDNKTGSLTITDIRTEHAGVYKAQINHMFKRVILKVSDKIEVKGEKSVTLSSGVSELKNDDQIQWMFGNGATLIAEINKQTNRFSVFDDVLDGRFRDRLKLDNKTGSLTITDTRTEHAGVYKLQTNSEINSVRLRVSGDSKVVSVKMRNSVTLSSGVTEMMDDDQIQWRFEDNWRFRFKHTLIAEINVTADRFSVFDDVLDGRFRDRLKLDSKTGSLTITDTTGEHNGDYKVQSSYINITFHLIVYDEISVTEGDSGTLNSCFTVIKYNTLIYWMFGNTLIVEIYDRNNKFNLHDDVLDGRFRDRLKLDNKTGSLTITDTRAEHAGVYELLFDRVRIRSFILTVDSVHCCGPTEAAIRLVLSALVGVAIVIIVLYDIRSRRAEQDQAHIDASQT